MNRKDIARRLMHKFPELDTALAGQIVNSTIECITDTLAVGEHVFLRGLGTLRLHSVKAKRARDIGRNTEIIIPAHVEVKYKMSRTLKERLNND